MKRILFTLGIIATLIPIGVRGAGISLSCSSTTLAPNAQTNCTISGYSESEVSALSAKLQSSGNISISNISTSSIWQGNGIGGNIDLYTENNKVGNFAIGSFTVTAGASGSGTVTITQASFSRADFSEFSVSGGSVTISVKESQNPQPQPPVNNNTNNNGNNNNNSTNNSNSNSNNNNESNTNNADSKSSNNNIKDLSVEGYKIDKKDANNYTLTVPNDVTSINIKATLEDSKSKITGTGKHNINVGENNIEIVVTAENGSENKINIKVTRKDAYYLEDLDSVLNNKDNDLSISINFDTEISSSDLEKIKNSKKIVKFNYYNEDKTLAYSWIIDGSKLKKTNGLLTTILNTSENEEDILRLSNYADGLFLSLKQANNLPTGAKIKMFVGDKYKDKDVVNVYAHTKNNDKLKLVQDKLKVNDGYIEFDIIDSKDYFITMSNIPDVSRIDTTTNNSRSSILPIAIGITILFIVIIILFIVKKIKNTSFKSNV